MPFVYRVWPRFGAIIRGALRLEERKFPNTCKTPNVFTHTPHKRERKLFSSTQYSPAAAAAVSRSTTWGIEAEGNVAF